MKTFKLLAVGLLTATAINMASAADVLIKITGSTAFRKAEYAGIVDYLSTLGTVKGAFLNDNGTTVLNGSNQAVFTVGTSPNKITIQCGQGGSSGGLRFTAQGVAASVKPDGSDTGHVWLAESNAVATVTLSGGQATGGTSVITGTATWDGAAVANITMADTYQDSTQWNSTDFTALTEIPGGALGIQGYVFAKGKEYDNVTAASAGAYARFTNVQPNAFQYLAANGVAPLALFTANSLDEGIDVVLVGRDYDSGTRCVTFYETGYGNDTTLAVQYRAQDAGNIDVGDGTGAGNIDHLVLATDASGDGLAGYNSGGFVKNVLNKAGVTTTGVLSPRGRPAILLAYVGTGDVPTVAGQILSFNGVAQSSANIAYGTYTFWDPEHMYYRTLAGANFTTAGTQKFVAKKVADLIRSTDITASSAVAIGAMKASRAGEGEVISSTLP